jgi:hypothetical protein
MSDPYDRMTSPLDEIQKKAAALHSVTQDAIMRAIGVVAEARHERSEWLRLQPPPDWFGELLAALEWQGGTIYEALNCVRRLVAESKEREARKS